MGFKVSGVRSRVQGLRVGREGLEFSQGFRVQGPGGAEP